MCETADELNERSLLKRLEKHARGLIEGGQVVWVRDARDLGDTLDALDVLRRGTQLRGRASFLGTFESCQRCRGRGVDSDEPACGPASHAWSARSLGDPVDGECVWCGQPRCEDCFGTGRTPVAMSVVAKEGDRE